MRSYQGFILSVGVILFSCSLVPQKVNYHDEKMKPFLDAISLVNRDSLGFTPISENSDIRIEGASESYVAMLHIYHETSRTIAFRKAGARYVWIGEQEIHTGPRKYKTPDGTFNETITVNYDIEPLSGFPINRLVIQYNGPDSNLYAHESLELKDVLPIIGVWDELEINKYTH